MMSEDGHEKILFILSRGDLIGEVDFFTESSHDYQVTVLDETVVKIIPKDVVNNEISLDTNIYQSIIKSIIRKYQIICAQIMDCLFKSSDGKIASILIRIAEQEGRYIDNHIESLYLKHQDLSDLLGCSRVTISKTFNKFKSDGSIEFIDKKTYILNEAKLRTYTV
jgi:CRP-like cAMP-binding protein